jgi:chromate reductase, NAD(P)H dehydrogenase (quinone)
VTSNPSGIRIVLISGSVRVASYTGKAMAFVADEIKKHPEIALEVINPAGMNLPLPGTDGSSADAAQLRESVSQATGVILATPEYHGSFSSVIKLVIENLGFPSVLAGKTVTLLGVAAGQIGAIKAVEGLASVCMHVGAIVLPGAVSVANVREVFDADGRCLDPGIEKRVRSVAINLIDYIQGAICPRIAMEAMARGGSK